MPAENPVQLVLREEIASHPDPLPTAVARTGVSRKTVQRHLATLRKRGVVLAAGPPRQRRYRLAPRESWSGEVDPALEAHDVAERCDGLLEGLPPELRVRVRFGLLELLENVRLHAQVDLARVLFVRADPLVEVSVSDQGPGLLRTLVQGRDLEDERHAALELSKGLVSTVDGHVGQGIRLLLAAFDRAVWWSGTNIFGSAPRGGDRPRFALARDQRTRGGTTARLVCDARNAADLEQLRETTLLHCAPAVALARAEDHRLDSRAAAERLLSGCQRFAGVHLDLASVEAVGDEFCDEAFVAFPARNPDVQLTWGGGNPAVRATIEAALRRAG